MTDAQLDLLVGISAIILAQEGEQQTPVAELLCDLIKRVTRERAQEPIEVKWHARG